MSQDWIEAAAKEIGKYFWGSLGYKAETDVSDILRRHAPPVPQWCERPTIGKWFSVDDDGTCDSHELEIEKDVLEVSQWTGLRWYGPITPARRRTMPKPTDKELLEFVMKFSGKLRPFASAIDAQACLETGDVPDYLHSVDAFIRDVWPKVKERPTLSRIWLDRFLEYAAERDSADDINADARSRCLALYRALDGTLPEQEKRDG